MQRNHQFHSHWKMQKRRRSCVHWFMAYRTPPLWPVCPVPQFQWCAPPQPVPVGVLPVAHPPLLAAGGRPSCTFHLDFRLPLKVRPPVLLPLGLPGIARGASDVGRTMRAMLACDLRSASRSQLCMARPVFSLAQSVVAGCTATDASRVHRQQQLTLRRSGHQQKKSL